MLQIIPKRVVCTKLDIYMFYIFNGLIHLLVDYLLVNVGTIRLVISVFVTDMIHKIYLLLQNIDGWLLCLCSFFAPKKYPII
jgi:hypothetical protein